MKNSIMLSCLLIVGACASADEARRPAATAQTEPQRKHAERAQVAREGDADHAPGPQSPVVEHAQSPGRQRGSAVSDLRAEPVADVPHDPAPAEKTAASDSRKAIDKEPRDGVTAVAPAESRSADNTGINQRDANQKTLTPFDQRENAADRTATQRIRQAVVADDSLSFTAKNAKIITADGRVTLRGPVKSAAERATIAGYASKVVGASHVDNQLEIAK